MTHNSVVTTLHLRSSINHLKNKSFFPAKKICFISRLSLFGNLVKSSDGLFHLWDSHHIQHAQLSLIIKICWFYSGLIAGSGRLPVFRRQTRGVQWRTWVCLTSVHSPLQATKQRGQALASTLSWDGSTTANCAQASHRGGTGASHTHHW